MAGSRQGPRQLLDRAAKAFYVPPPPPPPPEKKSEFE